MRLYNPLLLALFIYFFIAGVNNHRRWLLCLHWNITRCKWQSCAYTVLCHLYRFFIYYHSYHYFWDEISLHLLVVHPVINWERLILNKRMNLYNWTLPLFFIWFQELAVSIQERRKNFTQTFVSSLRRYIMNQFTCMWAQKLRILYMSM